MKRREEEVDESVEQHLKLFSAPPVQEIDDAKERTRRRLSMQPVGETNELTAEYGARPTWRWRFAVVAAAAVALFAVVMKSPVIRESIFGIDMRAVVEVADGGLAMDSGRVLQAGERITDDETVRANGSGAMLKLVDGSHIEMRAQSRLSLERANDGVRIHLNQGDVIVNAAKQHGHLYVQTQDVTVSVVGTVFLVKAEAEGSRVSVIEGEVRVQQGTTEEKLLPGQQVNTNPLSELQPMSQEFAWSSRAPEHMALLQQTAAIPAARDAFDVISIRPTTAPASAGVRGAGGGGGFANRTRNPRGDNPCSVIVEPQIDPRRFDASNVTIIQLIDWAYSVDCVGSDGAYLLSGGPEWMRKDGYDVQADRPDGPNDYTNSSLSGTRPIQIPGPKIQRMLQSLLADRFKLAMHRETREMSAYVLSVANGGPKYTASRPAAPGQEVVGGAIAAGSRGSRGENPQGVNPEFSVWKEGDNPCCDNGGPASIDGRKKHLSYVTQLLEYFLGRPILDRTGLTGDFNFFLNFAPIQVPGAPPLRVEPGGAFATESIFDVLKKVGLDLKLSKEKVDVWVIDRVDRPTEN